MTGGEIMEWIKENRAEKDEIYVEVRGKLFKQSEEMFILGSEDCPCMEMVVIR